MNANPSPRRTTKTKPWTHFVLNWPPQPVSALIPLLTLLATASPLMAQPHISIAPAAEVSWQSLPNKLYQVMASDSLTSPAWSEAGSPVLGTGALVRKVLLRGDAKHRFFRVVEQAGTVTNWLEGLSELDLRPAKLTAQAGGLLAEGVRVTAVGITMNDFVTARFQFDEESQSLRLVQYQVIPDVGVSMGRFFSKDVALHVTGRRYGVALSDYTYHSLSGTNIVIDLALEIGQVLNFLIQSQSREYGLELLDPDGQQQTVYIGAPNAGVVFDGIPILRSGKYQLRIRPRTAPAVPMSCECLFANNNAHSLVHVTHGSTLAATLRQNTQDYAKYSMTLAARQVVRLPAPAPGIGFLVLNARSQQLLDTRGLPMVFVPPGDGTYYLFIYKLNASDGDLNYSGTITIGSS